MVKQVAPVYVAELAGIKPGALIEEVNRKIARDAEEFERVVERTPKNEAVLTLSWREITPDRSPTRGE